jgi:hypothetical protein
MISSKFCMGGSVLSRANKLLYAPAPPPPSVWALKPPSWALVHKTTSAPIFYTALCIMFWMHAYPLLGRMALAYWLIAVSQGPKMGICTHPKHYARGCINHRRINSYYNSDRITCTKQGPSR